MSGSAFQSKTVRSHIPLDRSFQIRQFFPFRQQGVDRIAFGVKCHHPSPGVAGANVQFHQFIFQVAGTDCDHPDGAFLLGVAQFIVQLGILPQLAVGIFIIGAAAQHQHDFAGHIQSGILVKFFIFRADAVTCKHQAAAGGVILGGGEGDVLHFRLPFAFRAVNVESGAVAFAKFHCGGDFELLKIVAVKLL